MLGAIAGDIIGSVFEHKPIKTTDFPLFAYYSRFTDDTVLMVAIADTILEKVSYKKALRFFAREYPDAGYASLSMTECYLLIANDSLLGKQSNVDDSAYVYVCEDCLGSTVKFLISHGTVKNVEFCYALD
jgi:hypothetical protein